MPTKRYLRDTQTETGTTGAPGSLGSVIDLSTTQGAVATLASGINTSDSFVVGKRFTQTVGAGVVADGTQNYAVSIDMASVDAEFEIYWRFRALRLNSAGVQQAASSYSSEYIDPGIKAATLSMDAGTWESGDRLCLDVEIRTNALGFESSFVLNVNDADSYVETVDSGATGQTPVNFTNRRQRQKPLLAM